LLVNIYCFGSSVYNVLSLSEIYTGSVDVRDLQVQIKIGPKTPYVTIFIAFLSFYIHLGYGGMYLHLNKFISVLLQVNK
jgi:hypothetical protein